MNASNEIRGLEETQRRMQQMVSDLRGEPVMESMRIATLLVDRDAKRNSPSDTGRLRASITPEVTRPNLETTQGVVGSNLSYAPYVELGTRPHFPPLEALAVWAVRHGMSAYQVALSISQYGTEAVRFLEDALDMNQDEIRELLNGSVTSISAKANNE